MPLPTPFFLAYAPALCTRQLMLPDAAVWCRLLIWAPLLEEWVLRAGLQEWLTDVGRRRSARAASTTTRSMSMLLMPAMPAMPALLSTAAFGALHLGAGWPFALAVMAPGLALALLYQRVRDWRWCVLTHALFNLCALFGCTP